MTRAVDELRKAAPRLVRLARREGIGLVDYSAVQIVGLVHLLQGGGVGLGGLFIEATWCGIDRSGHSRWWRMSVPTKESSTCRSCLRNRDAAARRWRT